MGESLTPEAAEVALERGLEELHPRRLVAVRELGVEAEEDPRVQVESSFHGQRRRRGLVQRSRRLGFSPPRFPRRGSGWLRGFMAVVWEESEALKLAG